MEKRGIVFETLVYWLIAIIVLVIAIVGYMILRGKGAGLIDAIKTIFSSR